MAITWLSLALNYLLVKSADPAVKWFYTLAEFIISLQGFEKIILFLLLPFHIEDFSNAIFYVSPLDLLSFSCLE